MAESGRLGGCIEWIDVSFVERKRAPEWAIQGGIRCHLAAMSLRDASQHLEIWESNGVTSQSMTGYTNAERQPVSTVTEEQIAVDETST